MRQGKVELLLANLLYLVKSLRIYLVKMPDKIIHNLPGKIYLEKSFIILANLLSLVKSLRIRTENVNNSP